MSEEFSIKKILLMGLSNSGKTSIVQSYQGIKNLPAYCAIKPTIQINRVLYQAVEADCTVWDFGGQASLIKGYLKDFIKYLTGTSQIIFAIDIQDEKKYNPALNYLKKIVSLLKENNRLVKFSVFLHKYDPDLEQTNPTITEDLVKDLVYKIKEIFMGYNFEYDISKTTIYARFERVEIA